jgi:DtxR family Mn-dependent transcriptional regulator
VADLHDTTEQYLLTVLELEEESIPPLRARLVERLGLSAPTVSETVARLEGDGFVHVADDRVIELTAPGRELAVSVARKHRLAERLLHDVIGLPWEQIHQEACKWEHVISDEVEQRLVELLGDPGVCPHGNAIPGSSNPPEREDEVTLDEVEDGSVRVTRISEELQTDVDLMRQLANAGLKPGGIGKVTTADGKGVRVVGTDGAGDEVELSSEVARLVFVVPS